MLLASLLLGLGQLALAPDALAAYPTCQGVDVTMFGTAVNDQLTGTDGNDVIAGLGGDDTIDGHGGNDLICGGDGNDNINGGRAGDSIWGGPGNDYLEGTYGLNDLHGQGGADDLIAQSPNGYQNDLYGGGGPDDFYGYLDDAATVIWDGDGVDELMDGVHTDGTQWDFLMLCADGNNDLTAGAFDGTINGPSASYCTDG